MKEQVSHKETGPGKYNVFKGAYSIDIEIQKTPDGSLLKLEDEESALSMPCVAEFFEYIYANLLFSKTL